MVVSSVPSQDKIPCAPLKSKTSNPYFHFALNFDPFQKLWPGYFSPLVAIPFHAENGWRDHIPMVGLAPNAHSMAVGIPMAYRDHIRLHRCKLLPPWEISIVLAMARGSNGEFSAMGESLTKQCCVELYLPRAGREQSCAITLVDKIVRCQSVRAGSWILKRHDSETWQLPFYNPKHKGMFLLVILSLSFFLIKVTELLAHFIFPRNHSLFLSIEASIYVGIILLTLPFL